MPELQNSDITLLCRVIDNYGDIGVVFRLAKALSKLLPGNGRGLRLLVDDLLPFAQISPGLDPEKPVQTHRGWTVCRWDAEKEGRLLYAEEPPFVIVECFACGRPEWLDSILFDKELQNTRLHDVQIINLEYLTAEPYADEFHKLMSLTRSARVRKVNFMPGFTLHTGGLILDGVKSRSDVETGTEDCGSARKAAAETSRDTFRTVIFSYERDFASVAEAFARFHKQNPGKKIKFLSAAGKSAAPFRKAFDSAFPEQNESSVPAGTQMADLVQLDFLSQEEWDSMLYSSDFLFIRGEDSLSRACLSGLPFIWHAYPQSEMYHLVKVQALLDRLEPFFLPEDYVLLRDYWLWYNGSEIPGYNSTDALLKLLERYSSICMSFGAFSKMLIKNGNLAEHLMTFIREIV